VLRQIKSSLGIGRKHPGPRNEKSAIIIRIAVVCFKEMTE